MTAVPNILAVSGIETRSTCLMPRMKRAAGFAKCVRRMEIATLRPTQMTVGFREVEEKQRRIRAAIAAGRRTELARRSIPVVIGPGALVYALDRHHRIYALIAEGVSSVDVLLVEDMGNVGIDAFWPTMDKHGWCRPYDNEGRRREYEDLPDSFADLLDDPFRSLASAVRRAGGFPKDPALFSEFATADFLRQRIDRQIVESDFDLAVMQSLHLISEDKMGSNSTRHGASFEPAAAAAET